MRALMQYITNSTLKREFALFLTLWLLGAATYLLLVSTVSDMQFRILELFAYPILVGAFGVFGLDWVSKQTNIAGPPANTETTVKTELTDTTATVTTTSEPAEPKP
jgi:hypothetical protein